jgi:hypothetical protein
MDPPSRSKAAAPSGAPASAPIPLPLKRVSARAWPDARSSA